MTVLPDSLLPGQLAQIPNNTNAKWWKDAGLRRLFNVLWYVGSIIAAWLTFGTGHLTSTWSWRIPSIVQGVPALLVLLSTFSGMPESPRYLISRNRPHDALHILATYHANGDRADALVAHELAQITAALAAERAASKTLTWRVALRSRAHRARFALCLAVAVLTLWNGQGVISYYFSPILSSIGIASTAAQTGINGGMQVWNLVCSAVGAVVLAERLGRRPLWLLSFAGMMAANVPLTVASARYAAKGSQGAARAVVVFLFLYNAAFNLACNPLLYAYVTEILPYGVRTKGLALQIAASQAALTVNNYVNPIALEAIGYWYFVFYLGMLVAGMAFIWLFFPETKGKSLEELVGLFGDEKGRGLRVVRRDPTLTAVLDGVVMPVDEEDVVVVTTIKKTENKI
ncbi:Sugar transporter [Lasiodiplodia theobromae]|uniref:Sugar transporter n=1 Tax=Lasiodiplodia theobromae TaxID=45133 RepID=UPI0015C2F88A|nr:Sugar transporter [Lasiodiplodia theobromae]KAF4540679.1 Sugar transporter [Lasiodiplodia theobromae]